MSGLGQTQILKPPSTLMLNVSEDTLMKFPRRRVLQIAASAAAVPTLSRFALAQAYPNRPVHLIAPFPPGGVVDLFARLIGQLLSERLGQQFVIENRPGAGGNLGTEFVVHAAPDGYTLLMIATPNVWNGALYGKLNFDFVRDVMPVASIYRGPSILVVHPSFPANTVPELIAYAKVNPGKINMASGGIGSSQHVYGELFKMMAGVELLHVPYRGGGPALTDLLGGQVPLMFDTLATSIEYIRAGKLRPLAVTSAARLEVLPQIPTVAESVPGYEAIGWQGIGAPKDTPAQIIDRLNEAVGMGLADPRVKTRIADFGYMAYASSPVEFGQFIRAEAEKWTRVIKFSGAKLE
jgi:tripartite-type tricarboxylate transporter receptor subunit TctC